MRVPAWNPRRLTETLDVTDRREANGAITVQQHPEPHSRDDDHRRALLDAAHQMVNEDGGLRVTLDQIAFDEVCARARLSRSSAYRIWRSQSEFKLDLLRDLAGPSWQGTAAFDQDTIEIASEIVAQHISNLVTPQGRREVVLEAVRLAAKRNFQAIRESVEWRTYVALLATILTLSREEPGISAEVRAALTAAEQQFVDTMTEFYARMSIILGFRLKPEFSGFETLAAMGAAIVEGLALRHIVSPALIEAPIMIDHGYGPKEWTIPALGFLSILDALTEPDEAYDPADALKQYLGQLARTR